MKKILQSIILGRVYRNFQICSRPAVYTFYYVVVVFYAYGRVHNTSLKFRSPMGDRNHLAS